LAKLERLLAWILLLSVAGLVLFTFARAALISLSPGYEEYANRIPFDSASWQDEDQVYSDNPVRLRMVDDLLKRYQLVGISKAKIDELLGPPTKTEKFGDYDYVYWLGPERGFIRIDSEWLGIKFQ